VRGCVPFATHGR